MLKSISVGCKIPQHELTFLASIPDMPLGSESDIEDAFFCLCEAWSHRESDPLKAYLALTKQQAQMLLFFTHEGGGPHDGHPTRQQHWLRVALAKGLQALDELQESVVNVR